MTETAAQTQRKHAPGTFCWIELSTPDGPAAKEFYTKLFGWEAQDNLIGPNMIYTMLTLNGKDAGALYEIKEMMGDLPTAWASYISVTSADETVRKAQSLGATIIRDASDVAEVGRMAVITDPTGATFCIWQAKSHTGVGTKGEPNAHSWNELQTADTAKATDFYTKLFGWTTKTDSGPMAYTEFRNGDEHVGGMMQIQPDMGPMPPHWGIYFAVEDCDATVEKATSLGGKVYVPPMDIEHVGRFATLSDPQGAVFSVIKLAEHHEQK